MNTGLSNRTYPRELVNFIRRIQVDPKGVMIENRLDRDSAYVSRVYTPHNRVSQLATYVIEDLAIENIRVNEHELDSTSYIPIIRKSGVLNDYPFLKKHFRIVLLEAFSMSFAMNDKTELLKFIDQEDIGNTRETIKYILDVMGPDVRYTPVILMLQDLDLALGYNQAQVAVIKREAGIE